MIAVAVAVWWGGRLTWDDDILDSMASMDDGDYDRNPVSGY